MVCKSEWWSVLSGRHESHHMIPVGVVSCDPVRVGVSQRRTFFFPIDNFKQISHGVVHKNGETPAVIGQLAIVRADQLPTNGVSHLRPMQQHSREFNVCMLCNTCRGKGHKSLSEICTCASGPTVNTLWTELCYRKPETVEKVAGRTFLCWPLEVYSNWKPTLFWGFLIQANSGKHVILIYGIFF